MLVNFLEPHPDEILYSMFARYGSRMGYPSQRAVLIDLFGSVMATAVVDFPSHLDRLAENLSASTRLSADYLINRHTSFPFYEAFLPENRIRLLRADMHGDQGGSICVRAGVAASNVTPPRWLRYCPLCATRDIEDFGETYWHRIHQLPAIEVCAIHSCDLVDSSAQIRPGTARQTFMAANQHVKSSCLPSYYHRDAGTIFSELAQEAQVLLDRHCSPLPLAQRQVLIREALTREGFVTTQNNIRFRLLADAFMARYSSDVLRDLQCELDPSTQNGWLAEMLRTRARVQHPVRYLLLMNFLGISVTTQPSLAPISPPFGDGPWPCLNPACSHYLQPHICTCELTQTTEPPVRPVGHFRCECGYAYARTGTKSNAPDYEPPARILTFGHIWERRLAELWHDPMYSLRAIAQSLKVDPATVKLSAVRMWLPFPRKAARPTNRPRTGSSKSNKISELTFEDIRSKHREKWLKEARQHPNEGKKALRQRLPASYAWLYRHDGEWLAAQQPRHNCPPVRKERVNWPERDTVISTAIRAAATRLRGMPDRPVYVSRTALLTASGVTLTIHDTLGKLPETRKVFEEQVESLEQFAIRRIRWATEHCLERDLKMAEWRFVRLAGVGRLVSNPKIAAELEKAMEVMQSTPHDRILP